MIFDIVFRHALVMTPAGRCPTDVGVRNGRIAALGDLRDQPTAATVDCTGLTILPGVIDSQVHFREPGLDHKEDLATGSAAAALGGVVAVFEMPNTKPSTTTVELVRDKLARAAGRMWTDHAFYGGGAVESTVHINELETEPGCAGIKVFMGSSTGSLLVADDAPLEAIVRRLTRRMAVHCEDEHILLERRGLIPATGATAHLHPVWRNEASALSATRRLVTLAEKHRKRVHVLHVSTGDEMAYLRDRKEYASVEVLANHLTLAAPECYDRLGTFAQQNPPIRDAAHRAALWAAVADGTVDVVATDHAPHTRAEKNEPYPASPSGMPGVQTFVPLMLDHVAKGRLSLERLVDLTSAGPQRLFGILGKGRIAVGYDADLTIVDLAATRTIRNADQACKVGWTPFDGLEVTGWPIMTVIRGSVVMRDGALLGQAAGRPVRFAGT
jgi:dihydroorotase